MRSVNASASAHGHAYDSDEEDNAPDSYKSPISRLIMRRPVQLSDGHSYEKKEIKKWLKRSDKSPCTGDTLENTTMTDNFTTNRALGSVDCNKYKGSIDIIINSTTKRI